MNIVFPRARVIACFVYFLRDDDEMDVLFVNVAPLVGCVCMVLCRLCRLCCLCVCVFMCVFEFVCCYLLCVWIMPACVL